jgi:hypothetical protein
MLGIMRKKVLKVNLLDVSPHNKAILEFFFAGAGSKLFRVSNKEDADAFIVDFDHPNARQHWEDINATLNKPTMVLAFYETDASNTVWLSKPLTTKALSDAAKKIRILLKNPEPYQTQATAQPSPAQRSITPSPLDKSTPAIPPKRIFTKRPPVGSNAAQLKHQLASNTATRTPQQTRPIIKTSPTVATPIASVPAKKLVATDVSAENNVSLADTQTSQKSALSEEDERQAKIKAEAKQKRWKKLCGELENIKNPNAWKNEVVFYTPENYLITSLQDALRLATQSQQMVQIKYQSATLYFMPETTQAYSNIATTSEEFESLCKSPVKKTDVVIHIMSIKEVELARSTLSVKPENVFDLENFMWTAMLLTSSGKLHRNIDIRRRVMLKQWPNLSRIETFPHVVRIAALWKSDAFNMLEVAHNLQIPQRYVFSFYNAACILGLMEHEPEKLKEKMQPKSPNKNRGLFSRLLKRLIG